MKKLFLCCMLAAGCQMLHAQFVATLQLNEPIPGICDDKAVYAMFPSFKGQEEAVCPVSEEAIQQRLDNELQFLKDHPSFKDKGMIGLIINCEGKLLVCKMDNKTKSEELDAQIEAVFNSLGEWKPAKLNGEEVDSSLLYSFEIKKGKLTME